MPSESLVYPIAIGASFAVLFVLACFAGSRRLRNLVSLLTVGVLFVAAWKLAFLPFCAVAAGCVIFAFVCERIRRR